MPNWVYNTLTIKGTKNRLIEIREAVKGDQKIPDGVIEDFDFYTIKEDGDFGVKWNACEPEFTDNLDEEGEETDTDYELEYTFNTAWSWPQPVIEAFCEKYPDVEVDYTCTEESCDFAIHGWNNKGELVYNEIGRNDIFHNDNKWCYIDKYFEQNKLNKDDYNLDEFFDAMEDNDIYWEVEDYGFSYNIEKYEDGEEVRYEDDFSELEIRPSDEDEFEELLEEYKNE